MRVQLDLDTGPPDGPRRKHHIWVLVLAIVVLAEVLAIVSLVFILRTA